LSSSPARSAPLAWGFTGLAAATFALVVLGSLVRANGAGLACPDWPLCFGKLVPAFDMRVAFEWGHRALAGGVAIGLALLTWALLREPELRRVGAGPLGVAWALLVVQVVLGGLTVLLLLAPWTVTAHLLVGTSFCVSLVWVARDLFSVGAPAAPPAPRPVRVLVYACAFGLALQVALGGMVSSHAAGLACAHFPTCDGASFVPALRGQVGLHVLHRLNGYALAAAFLVLAIAARRSFQIGALSRLALNLLVVQIAVGVFNVLLRLPVEVTAVHSAVACALALLTGLMLREALRSRAVAPEAVAAPLHTVEVR
jgi:cytochrome c oxidase assembly protein subunit 15